MVVSRRPGRFVRVSGISLSAAGILCLCLLLASGCQIQAVSTVQLAQHQQILSLDGLQPIEPQPTLHVSCAPPKHWEALEPTEGFCWLHQQWRSLDKSSGMGVAYIKTPIPLSAQMIVWFAKAEYASNRTGPDGDGKGHVLRQWTDAMGRVWFEAENARFHVCGFAMTRGTEAWIVYSGYRVAQKPSAYALELAARAADSVVPLPLESDQKPAELAAQVDPKTSAAQRAAQ